MNLFRIVPKPQYWGKGCWLWLNMLYSWDEIKQRMAFVDGVWCEATPH